MDETTLYIVDHVVDGEKVQGLFARSYVGTEVTIQLLGVMCPNGRFVTP